MMRRDNVKRAVAAIVIGVSVMAFGDALIKLIGLRFSLWQLYLLRSLIALPFFVFLMRGAQRPVALGWITLRGVIQAVMWGVYYYALLHVELSVAAAVYYTTPMLIVLFAVLFLGERAGLKLLFAVVLGFIGVLLLTHPRVEEFNWAALLPLLSAVLYATAMVLTRAKCAADNPNTIALVQQLVLIACGALGGLCAIFFAPNFDHANPHMQQINSFLFAPWSPLSQLDWAVMVVLAVVSVAVAVLVAYAYQNGPPPTIAAFDYTYVAASVLWGFVFLREIPDLPGVLGMLCIISGGLLALHKRKPKTNCV